MVTIPPLDHLIPLGAVFPISLVLVLLSIALGFWIGTQQRTIPEAPIGSGVGVGLGDSDGSTDAVGVGSGVGVQPDTRRSATAPRMRRDRRRMHSA